MQTAGPYRVDLTRAQGRVCFGYAVTGTTPVTFILTYDSTVYKWENVTGTVLASDEILCFEKTSNADIGYIKIIYEQDTYWSFNFKCPQNITPTPTVTPTTTPTITPSNTPTITPSPTVCVIPCNTLITNTESSIGCIPRCSSNFTVTPTKIQNLQAMFGDNMSCYKFYLPAETGQTQLNWKLQLLVGNGVYTGYHLVIRDSIGNILNIEENITVTVTSSLNNFTTGKLYLSKNTSVGQYYYVEAYGVTLSEDFIKLQLLMTCPLFTTATPTKTAVPTVTPTVTPTKTPTPTRNTPTPTPTGTPTVTPTVTPTNTKTPKPTPTPTRTPTKTVTPTVSVTLTPSHTTS